MRSTLVDIHDLLKGQIRPAYSSTNFPRATTGNGAQVVAQRGKEGTVRMSPSEATFSRCLKLMECIVCCVLVVLHNTLIWYIVRSLESSAYTTSI